MISESTAKSYIQDKKTYSETTLLYESYVKSFWLCSGRMNSRETSAIESLQTFQCQPTTIFLKQT